MTHARRFAFGGLGIHVTSPDAATLGWLEEFLAPAFTVDDGSAVDCGVHLIVDDQRYRALQATRPAGTLPTTVCFVLDKGAARMPRWSLASGDRVCADDEHGVLYVGGASGPHAHVVSPPGNTALRLALMRAVRELAMSAAWTHRSLVLHAAAVAVGDRGILIAGPKHAGKTSLLIHCLHAPGVHFLSNDRVVMDLDGGNPVLRGMPTIVSIRQGTLELFPELGARLCEAGFHFRLTLAEVHRQAARRAGDHRDRSASLSPVQLCHVLAVPMTERARAHVLVLPRIDPDVVGIDLQPLTAHEATARLPQVLFAAAAAERISEVFTVDPHHTDAQPATVQRLWLATVQGLRVLECRLGPDAFSSGAPAAFIQRVLSADTL
ncbi:MAG TPA: hypothetical protein VN812_04650 [Candidatus Acidoferrales bacterium]|nr:hypothetical protein [Candidatus Acidoferrales bacterium]